jgi:hypothetical protein
MLLLPDGEMGEAWEPSKKQHSFGNPGVWVEEYFHVFLINNSLMKS